MVVISVQLSPGVIKLIIAITQFVGFIPDL
jgi:hypothetical protein